jgi:hypothetical protein
MERSCFKLERNTSTQGNNSGSPIVMHRGKGSVLIPLRGIISCGMGIMEICLTLVSEHPISSNPINKLKFLCMCIILQILIADKVYALIGNHFFYLRTQ